MYILRGGRLQFSNNIVFLSLKVDFVLANSVDHDKMPHYAAFHLGLHCWPKTHLGVSGPQRVEHILILLLMCFQATTEGPCLELPEILLQYKILRSTISDFRDDPHVLEVLRSFRDFSTVLWLLHVRDELSLHLRKRGNQLHNEKTDGQVTQDQFIILYTKILSPFEMNG